VYTNVVFVIVITLERTSSNEQITMNVIEKFSGVISEFKGKRRWLSNFWPVPILYEGIEYPTAEHAYQAAKSLDPHVRMSFLNNSNPAAAKKLGQEIKVREDWDEVRLDVMREILKIKFSNPDMADRLFRTKNDFIIEGNFWHDNFWGNCFCVRCALEDSRNHLGELLMEVRKGLYEE